MSDVHNKSTRRKNMAAIRNKNTRPEAIVTDLIGNLGITCQHHLSSLPGKPDLYLPEHNIALFVHGCFWHGHRCHLFKVPGTRPQFWLDKIAQNRRRDDHVKNALAEVNVRQLVVWECSLKGKHRLPRQALAERIEEFVFSDAAFAQIQHHGFVIQ